jgi:hypothetical protein
MKVGCDQRVSFLLALLITFFLAHLVSDRYTKEVCSNFFCVHGLKRYALCTSALGKKEKGKKEKEKKEFTIIFLVLD